MNALEYGRRFIVDGYQPQPRPPVNPTEAEEYLLELNDLLEGGKVSAPTLLIEEEDGISAGILGPEAHAALHLFPLVGTLCLQVFSRRDVLLSDLTRDLAQRFGVGRFESHLGNATKALPKESQLLERVLAGDRAYARVRLVEGIFLP